jgi:FkbM family methyltransferase
MPATETLQDTTETPYFFRPTARWIAHLWKATVRQDHRTWKPIVETVLPADGIAIDVGAHGGQFSRLLASIANQGRIIAIEPSGYARSILRLSLWLRAISNVTIVAAATGSQPDFAILKTPIKNKGDIGYGIANLVSQTHADKQNLIEPVAVVTIDQVMENLAIKRLDFIKADIEGHEASMILGAARTIDRFRPAILLEQHDHLLRRGGSDLKTLWSHMRAKNYMPYQASGNRAVAVEPTIPASGDILWIAAEKRPT